MVTKAIAFRLLKSMLFCQWMKRGQIFQVVVFKKLPNKRANGYRAQKKGSLF